MKKTIKESRRSITLSEFVLSEDLFQEFKNKIEQEIISEFVEDMLHYPVEDVIKKWEEKL